MTRVGRKTEVEVQAGGKRREASPLAGLHQLEGVGRVPGGVGNA